MIMSSHLELTQLLLEENLLGDLNFKQKNLLLYGSIKPDLETNRYLPRFITGGVLEHTIKDTFDDTEQMIRSLFEMSHENRIDDTYYLTLGKVTHFLCDYFCSAHSPWFIRSMPKHLTYEFKLHYHLKNNRILYKHKLYNVLPVYCLSADHFIKHFKQNHQYFQSCIPSKDNDLSFALSNLATLYSSLKTLKLSRLEEAI